MPQRKSKGAVRRMGRPKLPKGEALTERVTVHLRGRDFEKLERIARERDLQIGIVVRELVEKALARRRK